MQFIHTFQLQDFLDTLVSLFAAFVLGTLIGASRTHAGSAYDWTGLSTGPGFELDDYNNNQTLIPIARP